MAEEKLAILEECHKCGDEIVVRIPEFDIHCDSCGEDFEADELERQGAAMLATGRWLRKIREEAHRQVE